MKNRFYLLVALSMAIKTANATGIGLTEGMWVLLLIMIGGILLAIAIIIILPVFLYKKYQKKALFIIVPLWIGLIFLTKNYLGY